MQVCQRSRSDTETRSRQVQAGVLEHKCSQEYHIKIVAVTIVHTINNPKQSCGDEIDPSGFIAVELACAFAAYICLIEMI